MEFDNPVTTFDSEGSTKDGLISKKLSRRSVGERGFMPDWAIKLITGIFAEKEHKLTEVQRDEIQFMRWVLSNISSFCTFLTN